MKPTKLVLATIALVALIVPVLAAPTIASAQDGETCEAFSETNQEVCGAFQAYWESNGGLPVFGLPLTGEFQELNWDTLDGFEVQYYERERFEYHPENAGTPYEILLGRLGVNLLEANGIDWTTLPKADPSAPYYMDVTGQAIAPEFAEYWSSHGLDLDDEGLSFRESLALFGYPVTPAEMETNADGDTVLTQWFERARFELHEDGAVLLGRLGAEMNASDGQLAIRVKVEMDATLRAAFMDHESQGMLAGLYSPQFGEWVGNIGVADPETGMPYSGDTYQRIGSLTKPVTATLILQLADQGLLSLDDTIDQWFDGVTYGDQITVRMLANMTSGIASYTLDEEWQQMIFSDPQRVWDPQELVDYGIGLEPSFEPGMGWEYSNTNYVMLGLIVEAVTGEDVRVALQEMILDPLGLSQTSFPAQDDPSIPEPFARGMTRQGLTDDLKDATHWNPSWGYTAGSMISTFDDLRVWARALGTGELLSPEMHAEQLTWVTLPPNTAERAYGMGIGYDHGWLGHEGSLPGYNTAVQYRPDIDAAIVVVTNSDIPDANGVSPTSAVYFGIMAIMNREYPLPSAAE